MIVGRCLFKIKTPNYQQGTIFAILKKNLKLVFSHKNEHFHTSKLVIKVLIVI